MKITKLIKIFFIFNCTFLFNFNAISKEAYFDLSEKEIKIQADFNGKEIIIFGVLQKNQDTIVTIKGPERDTRVLKKEKILGFWFNTKKVVYKELPTIFFLSSSSPVNEILSQESIIKEKLNFEEMMINIITQRNFIEQKNLALWNKNLIDIKTLENFYKKYKFENIEDKLFQTRVFFPSNSMPGNYVITIYQIKNKIIIDKKEKVINIKKSGIGEIIYKFAHEKPGSYGLLSIFFAILSGLIAATLFRRI